jgi:hypothetical protein
MEKNSTISTPPPLHFPKITFTFYAPLFKSPKQKSSHTLLLSSQITQTLETSKPKLNLVIGAKRMERGEKKQKLQPNPKPTLNKKLKISS